MADGSSEKEEILLINDIKTVELFFKTKLFKM